MKYYNICLAFLLLSCPMVNGCALSPSTRCLGDVLEKEIGTETNQYSSYRCTAGAHRGDSINYKENTLAALKAANDNPEYAFVEFDI
jgi:hypothetical protein